VSNLIVPNEAKNNWAQSQIDNTPTLAGSTLRLYSSPIVISTATTKAELEAIQATFPGYTAKPLENWTETVIVGNNAITEADPVTYEATAAATGNIYGCYVISGAGGLLLGVVPFDTPVPIPFNVELQAVIQIDFGSIFSL